MLITRILLLAAIFGLTACTSSPRYVGAKNAEDYGHFSRKISEDRYRVDLNCSRGTSLQDTRDCALPRAAELTFAKHFGWFQIVDRETATTEKMSYELRAGFGYERAWQEQTSCGLIGCTSYVRPATYASWRVDSARPTLTYSQSLGIVMGKGKIPEDGNYYDARAKVDAITISEQL